MTKDLPNYAFKLPWFIFDLNNAQLITSKYIPKEIGDTKGIVYAETPVYGLPYSPVNFSGMGNRKLIFTLPVIDINNTVGNLLLLKQLEMLRHPSGGLLGIFGNKQFIRNPKVLYWWGVGSLPLVYFVTKCDMRHRSELTNQLGQPTYTDVEFELTLDEEDPTNIMEEAYRKAVALTGQVVNTYGVINSL